MEDDIGRIRCRCDAGEARPDTHGEGSGRARGGDVLVGAYDKRSFSTESVSALVSRLDLLLEQGKVLKNDNASRVCRVEWDGHELVVKRFNHRGLIHSLRHSLKGSRARRGWLNGRRLLGLGIATPKPLAYVEQRTGPLVCRSYLICEHVQGKNLRQVLRDEPLSPDQRAQVADQVSGLLDSLRRHRILHGDLKATNILIAEQGPVLTDLDVLRINVCGILFRFLNNKDPRRLHKSLEPYLSDNGMASRQTA